MRLKDKRIFSISNLIIDELLKKNYIRIDDEEIGEVVQSVRRVIVEDLLVEDRLDEEVRELMQQYQSEIDKKHLEYFRMFRLIKNKLIKERNLIL